MRARSSLHVLVLFGLALVAGCATRPNPQVLNPVAVKPGANLSVTVLAATNRSRNANGFDSKWAGKLSYQGYTFSVPEKREGTKINYPTTKPKPEKQYVVTASRNLSEREFLNAAKIAAGREGTVGIFVHGYNYSYQEALFRMAQMGADAKAAGAPILFSWPSLASVTGYVGDRDAALASRDELDNLVKALSTAGPVNRIVLFGHSMGGFLVMETVRELKLQKRDDVLNKLTVVLAAPDIDLDVFQAQLRDIGRLKTPITLLVAKTDRALSASSFISGERTRVGRLDIDDPIVREAAAKEGVRVIDISNVQSGDGLGHDRYASLARFGSEFILNEHQNKASAASAGAFVFDAAGTVVASPFHLVGRVVGAR